MFLTVFVKRPKDFEVIFSRSGRLFGRFVQGLLSSADVTSATRDDCVILHYAGSRRVNGYAQREDGAWGYCVGLPSDGESASTDDLSDDVLRWLNHYLDGRDEVDFLRSLDGLFVFLFYDAAAQTLHVLPDLACGGLCFYLETEQYVALSNSSTVLAQLGGCQVDQIGAMCLFRNSFLLGSRTLFEGVHCLRGFTSATVTEKGVCVKEIATPFTVSSPVPSGLANLASYVHDVYLARMRNMQRRCENSPKPLLGLTGGLDSRIIAALAREVGLEIRGFYMLAPDRELEISSRVAQALGFEHMSFQTPSRTPEVFLQNLVSRSKVFDCEVPGPFGYYDLAQRGANSQDLILYGFGSEGILRSFWQLRGRSTWGASNARKAEILVMHMQAINFRPTLFRAPALLDQAIGYTIESFRSDVQDLPELASLTVANYLYCRHRMPRFVGRYINGLQEVVPCEAPLANFEVMRVTMHASPRVFDFHNLGRTLAVIAAPVLADIPYAKGLPGRPVTALWRQQWMRGKDYGRRAGRLASRWMGVDVEKREYEEARRLIVSQETSPMVTWRQIYELPVGEQLLSPDNLRNAALYDMAEYDRMLKEALDAPFSAHHPLSVVIQLEIAARRVEGRLVEPCRC